MKTLLTIFRNRLLDLSASNRSIFLPKAYKGKYSDLMHWDYLSAFSGLEVLKHLLSGNASVKIADVQHIKGEDLDSVVEEVKRLIRTHQLIGEETGSADFYVGWPFVEGVLKNEMPLRAPLAFFPYTLKIQGREIFLEKTAGVEAFWNRSLFLSLSLYEEYHFDKEWLELPLTGIEDTAEQDFRVSLIQQLRTQGWSISFERDFLSTNLAHFLSVTKEDLHAKYSPGQYQLKPYAVMGLFPQSASYIHADYACLKKEVEEQTVEQVFAQLFNPKKEEDLSAAMQFTPLSIDGSQENIINDVAAGKSLVVQGPPGSGKTQLICNLIAQFLGKGKKILVICQKRAALDVIYERLNQIDLSSFVSLVHDAVADKKEVYAKLADQIACAEEYKKQNIHPDTIVLEKEFSRVQSSIARLTHFFSKYKEALYDTSIGGDTAHALYLKANRSALYVDLSHEFRSIPAHALEAHSGYFEQYLFYYDVLKSKQTLFHDVHADYTVTRDDQEVLVRLLSNVDRLHQQIHTWEQEEEYLQFIPISYVKEWMVQLNTWQKNALIDRYDLTYDELQEISFQKIKKWEEDINRHFDVLQIVNTIPIEEQIPQWISLLKRYKRTAIKRLFFSFWGRIKYRKLFLWQSSLPIDWNKKGFDLLLNRLYALQSLLSLRKEWSAFPFIHSEEGFTREVFIHQINLWFQIQKEKEALFEIPALARLWSSHKKYKERLQSLVSVVKSRDQALQAYFAYWNPLAIDRIFSEKDYRTFWLDFVQCHFDYWLGFTQLKNNVDPLLWRSFDKIVQAFPSLDKQELMVVFSQSVIRCWIEEKERLAPILKTVSTPEWALKEQELQTLIKRRYVISLEFLKIKLREWVYAGITYNRLHRQVTYRDLNYQVTKKRNVWPLRKIISTHEEEVLSLLPCWLASPETASTIFPLHDLFDLVIFDEASQCFVEKAFPSLFRGKQAVVIGDTRQLKPSDLYRVRYKSDDEEEDIDYEIESLLEFSDRYLPSQMLKGHYRSKSEPLIRFSNEHFYDNALRVIPDVAYHKTQVLHYMKVNGIWENHVNRIEADKVVELVKSYLSSHPTKTIGVITFNYQQAFLIREQLEMAIPHLPSDVMIKNIENVQGDERDIIIFSVAYAKNTAGKMVSQFGSLSQDGGENRLNVAITRAKEKVVVVSSISPDDLQVDHHKNKGVQLLKMYMQYVYEQSNAYHTSQVLEQHEVSSKGLAHEIKKQFTGRYTSTHFSDLRDDSNEHQLIFTDEHRYFYAPSVSDWHGYSKMMFEQKGWKMNYVHARNFWFDRARFWNELNAMR